MGSGPVNHWAEPKPPLVAQLQLGLAQAVLWTNDHLEFLTAILTADTEEGLLRTATIILQSYYSCFAI